MDRGRPLGKDRTAAAAVIGPPGACPTPRTGKIGRDANPVGGPAVVGVAPIARILSDVLIRRLKRFFRRMTGVSGESERIDPIVAHR